MKETTESILNTTCNQKHCTLEYLIKQGDSAQDMSRAGMFKRFVLKAEGIEDWMSKYTLLSDLKLEKDAPQFTNYQAKYDSETREKLAQIKKRMQKSLLEGGVITKVLQTQFMLQLLMVNYLEYLRETKISLKADKLVAEEIDLPEMAAIFAEMMLTDREGDSLKEIQRILVNWRNA
ncbi:MAG: hypothetical protein SOY47_14690 [Lachnospiraceae bacterium]|nr:hypothetical protein [Lachnospiraceae bacterium]